MKRILHVLLLWNVCPALGFWSSSFRSPRARNKAPQIRSIIFPFAANPNERKRIRQSSFLLQRWKFHSFIALQDSEQPPENGSVDHSISSSLSQSTLVKKSSRICSIRSKNLGGSVASSSSQTNNQEDSFLSLNLQDGRLIAVTGETGAGKSILISKVIDLCSGGKASASLLSEEHPTATVEMDLELREPQLSMVKSIMRSFGLDPTTILNEQETNVATLHVQRTLSKSKSATRVTSKCQLQSTSVTLKQLQAIMSPLLAIVDAPAAASALQQPLSRLSMLDTSVVSDILKRVESAQMKHRRAKRQRMKLEKELISRTLPVSIAKEDGNADTALLQHWIDELDSFETRIQSFCESIAETNAEYGSPTSSLSRCFDALTTSAWMDAEDDMSTVYKSLLDLVDELKDLEGRIEAASSANMALNSLSSTTSVATALEQTRDYLMDATKGSDDGSTAQQAAEHSHDLLNQIEDALAQCAKFMEDDEKGLLAILERQRRACGFSVDEVFELLSEWNLISRKHGISPYLLPTCHKSLRQELDGNVEAKELLPKAIAAEQEAFEELVEASKVLSEARKEVASRLSSAISARLPLLGMESSTFEARVEQVNDVGVSTTALGVDAVDFILVHNGKGGSASGKASGKGGKVDAVASSGEKARILLAIECELPGSVRALCGTMKTGLNNDPSTETDEEVILSAAPPIAVVYDEIDAHVGGRAAVFLAQMLSDQSQSCQVLSITHSPSVAAVADTHVVIHKQSVTGENSLASTETTARIISGLDRRKELARMASGDLAMEEAEIFAEALLRDGASSASASSSSSTRR